MENDDPFCIFLIKNTSNERKLLIDFISELGEVDPIVREYPSARLWTDTYGVLPREYDPGITYEVKFIVNVCIIGRMMDKVKPSGNLPSFNYVKICDNEGYFLPTGIRLSDPYKTAIKAANRFLDYSFV
jgi:hypothetical protein